MRWMPYWNSRSDFMLWLVLSVLSALFDSLKDVSSKKILNNVSPEVAAFANAAFAVPITLLAFLAFESASFDIAFLKISAINGMILSVAFLLFMNSLKSTDVSFAVPFTALSPVFMLFLTPILIGERASLNGSAGVVLVALGAYILNAKGGAGGALGPVRAAMRDRGVMLMICVAFLWSITATVDKMALKHATPLLYITVFYIFTAVWLMINALLKCRKTAAAEIRSNILPLAALGFFWGLSGTAYILAIKSTMVSYVVAVKRMNALFTVLLGALLFKEKNLRERLLGAVLMVAGVAIISVF